MVHVHLRRVTIVLSLFALFLADQHTMVASRPDAAHATALATVNSLIAGIERGDIERVMSTFADDATAFFPGEPTTRATGKAEIRRAFLAVFAQQRSPLSIRAVDVEVQSFGDVAVVTAHLERPPNAPGTARRTFVLRRNGDSWQIVHLHASNVRAE